MNLARVNPPLLRKYVQSRYGTAYVAKIPWSLLLRKATVETIKPSVICATVLRFILVHFIMPLVGVLKDWWGIRILKADWLLH